jgi:hypothetical protein
MTEVGIPSGHGDPASGGLGNPSGAASRMIDSAHHVSLRRAGAAIVSEQSTTTIRPSIAPSNADAGRARSVVDVWAAGSIPCNSIAGSAAVHGATQVQALKIATVVAVRGQC